MREGGRGAGKCQLEPDLPPSVGEGGSTRHSRVPAQGATSTEGRKGGGDGTGEGGGVTMKRGRGGR